jgi:hypothetical protein
MLPIPCMLRHSVPGLLCWVPWRSGGLRQRVGELDGGGHEDEGDVPCTTSAVETPFQDPPRSKTASAYK